MFKQKRILGMAGMPRILATLEMGPRALALGLGLALGLVSTHGAEAKLDEKLKADGWDETVFDDKTPNCFFAPDSWAGEGLAIDLESRGTVSVAYKPFAEGEVDIVATPKLAFSWLSQDPDPDTDTTKKGDDDRTLAIYVAFPYQPEHATFGEKIERKAIEALHGKDTPWRVLIYVWGGGAPAGHSFENPYTGKYGQMIIVDTPQTLINTWHDRLVDVRGDFIAAFGYEPAPPVYVGIGADSDDTMSVIRASVRGLRFVAD